MRDRIKTKLQVLVILLIAGLNVYCLYVIYNYYDRQQQFVLPTIKQVQEYIGANPDGILGPETQRLWEEKLYKGGE